MTRSTPAHSRGYGILELVVVLAVAAALTPPLQSALTQSRELFHVTRALEDVASLIATARWLAVTHDGASVELEAHPPTARVLAALGDTLSEVRVDGPVSMTLSGGRSRAMLRFGPMGLGIVASQTIRFSMGSTERRIIVSSYGRVRRP